MELKRPGCADDPHFPLMLEVKNVRSDVSTEVCGSWREKCNCTLFRVLNLRQES
jgi:hypothetical protein